MCRHQQIAEWKVYEYFFIRKYGHTHTHVHTLDRHEIKSNILEQ